LRRKLFDDRHFNFLRGDLERVLYDEARDLADVRFSTTLTSLALQEGRAEATLSDGSSDSYDLVVGADGVHSRVRQLVFGGESQFFRYLGYETLAFVADPADLCIQRDAFETMTVPGRQVAVYPIRDGRIATFFIHRARLPSPSYSSTVARATLHDVYRDLDWLVPRLLECADRTDDLYFDAVAQIEMPRWSRGRVVLLGDAAWCLSLLAGQGASMAVAGAVLLDDALAESGAEVESALARYEVGLRAAILARQAAGRRMAFWFVPNSRLQIAVRDLIARASLWPGVDQIVKGAMGSGGKL
jgi:2-polyprenyl-6-methoxyphenol hydroxylase-like FAD-dependent oxidoreductase